MRIDFSLYGEEQLSRDLLRYTSYIREPGPAFREIASDMRKQIGEQFETEGERGSGGWEPDKDETLAAKAAKGLSPKVLQATGDLMDSLVNPSSQWHVEEITDDSLLLGSKDWVGFLHQKGTKTLAVRKPVDFTELDRRGFVRTLQRYVFEGVLA